jgi:uncharacterized protein (DUF58 family)
MADLRLLTLILLVIAALLRSEIFFYLLYVLIGFQVAAWFWVRTAVRRLSWRRELPAAAFPGEAIAIHLRVENQSLLPVPWLLLYESLPPTLHPPPGIRRVLALGAKGERSVTYTVQASRRGLYTIGPLRLQTGDVLGMREQPLAGGAVDTLTIFPEVVPLADLGLPAALPFGVQPFAHSLFTDPARPIGVRDYQPGDPPRQVDWKSSARVGTLQVRRYEPAIARTTLIALAFSRPEYRVRYVYDSLERAIVAAASIAVDLSARRQPVGVCTSGYDPIAQRRADTLAPDYGHAHMIELLKLLGRLEVAAEGDVDALLAAASADLGWGATVVIIGVGIEVDRLERLIALRRRGLRIALVLVEGAAADIALARQHGMAVYLVDRAGVPSVV